MTRQRQTEHCHDVFCKLKPNCQGQFSLLLLHFLYREIKENNRRGFFKTFSVFPKKTDPLHLSLAHLLFTCSIPACLNRDRPRCLHSPHLLKLKVQYFSLPLVKTHTESTQPREVQPYDKIQGLPSIKKSMKNISWTRQKTGAGKIRWGRRKMTWGWMLVCCGIYSFGPSNKDTSLEVYSNMYLWPLCITHTLLATRCLKTHTEFCWEFKPTAPTS